MPAFIHEMGTQTHTHIPFATKFPFVPTALIPESGVSFLPFPINKKLSQQSKIKFHYQSLTLNNQVVQLCLRGQSSLCKAGIHG